MKAEEIITKLCSDVVTRKSFNIRAISTLLGEEPKKAKHECLSALRCVLPALRLKKYPLAEQKFLNVKEAAEALCAGGRLLFQEGFADGGKGGIVCHFCDIDNPQGGLWSSFRFPEDYSFPLCGPFTTGCPAFGVLHQLGIMNLAFGGLYIGVRIVVDGNDVGYYNPAVIAMAFKVLLARNKKIRLLKISKNGTIIDKAMVAGGKYDRVAVLPLDDNGLVKGRCYRLDIVNGDVL